MEGGRGGVGRGEGGRGEMEGGGGDGGGGGVMKSRLKETAEKMRSNSQSYKIRS